MRHWLLGLFFFIASPLVAQGEYFPRDVLAYIQVEGGSELIDFCDPDGLLEIDDDLEAVARILKSELPDLTRLELALVDIAFDGEQPTNVLGIATYSNSPNTVLLKKLGLPVDQLEKTDYQGAPLYQLPLGGGRSEAGNPSLYLSMRDNTVFAATHESVIKDAIDASLGKQEFDDLLSSNPRFQLWQGENSGAFVRLFVDMVKVLRLLDQFAGANPYMFDQAFVASGEWLGWRSLEYINLQLSRGVITCDINFSSGVDALSIIPGPTTLSTLSDLPPLTLGFMSFSLGNNVADTWQRIMGFLYDAQIKVWNSYSDDNKPSRDIFDERFRPASRYLDDVVEDIAAMGFRRAAHKLKEQGTTRPWSGTTKDLAKILGDTTLTTSFLDYHPGRIEGLACADEGSYTGIIEYVGPENHTGYLTLDGGMRSHFHFDGDVGENLPRNDVLPGVPTSEVARAYVDAFSVAVGMTKHEFAACVGDNATLGFAVNPLEGLRGNRLFDDDESWFVTVDLRDGEALLETMVETMKLIPEAHSFLSENEHGELQLKPGHQTKYVKAYALGNDGEQSFAMTKNRIFIGPTGIIAQLAEGKRDRDLLGGSALSGTFTMGGSTNAMMKAYASQEFPILPLRHPIHSDPVIDTTTLAVENSRDRISLRLDHRFESLSALIDQTAGSFFGGYYGSMDDEQLLERAYERAQLMYRQRLSDPDPRNDHFPSVREALSAILKDARKPSKEDEWDWEKEMLKENNGQSTYFNGSIADHWQFVELDEEHQAPHDIIALSRSLYMGKILAASKHGEILMLNSNYAKKLRGWFKNPTSLDPRELDIPQVVTVSDTMARLWLERLWLAYLVPDIQANADEFIRSGEGVVHYLDRYGKLEVLSISDQGASIRISGYGHWMEIDSQLGGVTATSWDGESVHEDEGGK